MAMRKRFPVAYVDVFPGGTYLQSAVEQVADFNATRREDGSRPQQIDKESGLPMWQVVVLDADEEAGKKDVAITVKFAAKVQPVPPANRSGLPWTPVEFVGLTALPYVDDNGSRPRLAWSFRAEGMVEPGSTSRSGGSEKGAA